MKKNVTLILLAFAFVYVLQPMDAAAKPARIHVIKHRKHHHHRHHHHHHRRHHNV